MDMSWLARDLTASQWQLWDSKAQSLVPLFILVITSQRLISDC